MQTSEQTKKQSQHLLKYVESAASAVSIADIEREADNFYTFIHYLNIIMQLL